MVIESVDAPARPTSPLERALKDLNARTKTYKVYCDYYDGEQPLTFATERYRDSFARMVAAYTENMCPTVVDTIADRLEVSGFGLQTQGDAGGDAEAALTDALWALWNECRMDLRSGEVHQEAVKTGDGYVIVWPDAANHVQITPQPSQSMTVHYDEESGAIDWAAKWWMLEDNRARLNLYFADHIEKYVTRNVVRSGSAVPGKASAWVQEDPALDLADVRNPYGRVPVFHFANNAPSSSAFGRSDLKNVIPLQDALNKAVADMLVTMEFAAFPQRWVTGLQQKLDANGQPVAPFEAGVERIWTAQDIETRFGQFEPASLEGMLAAQDKFLLSIARVSGVPTHYMLLNPSAFPSGESLKTAEARFIAKVKDRQLAFGNVWEDVMTFAALVQDIELPGQLETLWTDASPRSDFDMAQTATLKKGFGVSNEQLQREFGYTEEQIEQMAGEAEAAQQAAVERNAAAFDRGLRAV